jgi:hypothetical protein
MGANTVSECLRQGQFRDQLNPAIQGVYSPSRGLAAILGHPTMIITHRIALDRNGRQEALLRQHAGYMPGLPETGGCKLLLI